MVAREVEIPDELKILNPEIQKEVVVIGAKGYEMYPMTEGQAERLSMLLSKVMSEVFSTDMQCRRCGLIHEGMYGKKSVCDALCDAMVKDSSTGAVCGGQLATLQRSPVDALFGDDRLVKMLSELLGLKENDVREKVTVPQLKHIAGVIWKLNFDDSLLPREAQVNFQKMAGWLGLGGGPSDSGLLPAPSMKPSPESMGLPASTSRESGE